jgi:hypothetical protein
VLFDPLAALASLITGKMAVDKAGKIAGLTLDEADRWFRFGASLFGTAFVSFAGSWGLSIWALYPKFGIGASLGLGFADGLIAMAATVFLLWSRSPLTQGIPLMVPSKLAEKAVQQDSTYTERS